MDPITYAARQFHSEMEAFWETGRGSMLRMIARDEERSEVVKALRVTECSQENRWPLFLHEMPFTEPHSYFRGFCERISHDYDLLRQGAAEEGVTLAPFSTRGIVTAEGLDSVGCAVVHMERAAVLLGERLDGALFALVPTHVKETKGWQESIARLAAAPFSSKVRLATADQPGGPLERVLGGNGARFAIDRAKLIAYTKKPAGGAHNRCGGHGNTGPEMKPSLGPLLLDATEQARQGDHAAAAEIYRRAIAVCRAEELVLEEAGVRMALAGTLLAIGDGPAAVKQYQNAAELGESHGALPIVCQAHLAAGGVCLAFTRYKPAAKLYELAAEAADNAKIPLLRIEALRMAGTCHVLRGAKEDALLAWVEALNAGLALGRSARHVGTLEHAAVELHALLVEVGLSRHAAEVEVFLQSRESAGHPRRDGPSPRRS